jgi:hypothetical protein
VVAIAVAAVPRAQHQLVLYCFVDASDCDDACVPVDCGGVGDKHARGGGSLRAQVAETGLAGDGAAAGAMDAIGGACDRLDGIARPEAPQDGRMTVPPGPQTRAIAVGKDLVAMVADPRVPLPPRKHSLMHRWDEDQDLHLDRKDGVPTSSGSRKLTPSAPASRQVPVRAEGHRAGREHARADDRDGLQRASASPADGACWGRCERPWRWTSEGFVGA